MNDNQEKAIDTVVAVHYHDDRADFILERLGEDVNLLELIYDTCKSGGGNCDTELGAAVRAVIHRDMLESAERRIHEHPWDFVVSKDDLDASHADSINKDKKEAA